MLVEKNKNYTVTIKDIGSNGEGIGKYNDFAIFVPNCVTGDEVEVKIIKTNKNFAVGKIIRIVNFSNIRVPQKCNFATQCGGCQFQHVNYEYQLEWKQNKVKNALYRIGGIQVVVNHTIGMPAPFYYRNKAQYPIQKINDEIQIGFYANKSHNIINIDKCIIQDEINESIIKIVKDFLITYNVSIYKEENHNGLIRHLVIRSGYYNKNVMICLVINGDNLPYKDKLVEMLCNITQITSVILNFNKNKTNVILGDKYNTIFGADTIQDNIGNLIFNLSPLSFFQVNPIQTNILYKIVEEYADLKGTETVLDLYCGIGTITLTLAQNAKKVYGVEIVEQAIKDAKQNALNNNINNVEFIVGKAEEIDFEIHPDIVVLDPPRKGCELSLINTLLDMLPSKIIYVSCDPATLARDISYLKEQYHVEKVQPIDMFPHTNHVETVVLMSRK
ncbi:MAG: 23S rRNA (uracil-5-)-methyltransferase RumA [Candidatus Epulonipiscium fishelsonii]|nr:MAG: 23S rRNA (uracil-5-)-methyltransferase RumA [Epulopiscium sp. AS2M-Bin002]